MGYMGKTKPLNPKQQSFVSEYLKDKNGSKAAIRAGYSKKTARQIADRLLTKVDVRKAVNAGLASQAKKCEVTAELIIERLSQIAFSENFFTKDSDIIKACELLAKRFKLFTDTVEISGNAANPLMIITLPDNGRRAPPEDDGSKT